MSLINEGEEGFVLADMGELCQEIRPLQQSYQFDYDERGSLSRLIDPKGNETAYHYNPDGQLTQQQLYAQGNLQAPERTTEYHYTRSGQLESYSDGFSSASYQYTPTHQLQAETTHYGSFIKTVGYSYYDNGDLKTLTDPEGKINEYRYDANRQLESVTIPGVGIYTISSYDWFAPEEISWPGGTKRALEYDGLMQLKTITVKDPAETTQMAYAYSYDNAGNIKTKATEHGDYAYQYDNLHRLLEAQNPNSDTEKFTYDAVGNRKTTEKSPTPWLYNANHELQSRPQISYEYDANGSTTQITQDGQNTHLIYNAANRLAEIKNNANQTVATYQYDPFGRRISKEVNGTTTYFIYTPQGLAGEYTSTGTLIRGYGYKPGGHWTTDPLYLKTGNTREQYFFYQNDHLGTPQKLMSTTGAIVWSAKYEAFGKYTSAPLQATAQPVENPLRFAGQYEDQETGWHYNWHRYYSPELGRYITSDPIGLEGGLNTYAYVGGNPVSYFDVDGLLKVYIWNYGGSLVAWGHASMTLNDGTHISWWPAGSPRNRLFGTSIYDAPANINQTLRRDIEMEGKIPDSVIYIDGLDELAILSWWEKFQKEKKWKTLSQNCSTTVSEALDAGGGGEGLYWDDWNHIWKPNDVKTYARSIKKYRDGLAGPKNIPVIMAIP